MIDAAIPASGVCPCPNRKHLATIPEAPDAGSTGPRPQRACARRATPESLIISLSVTALVVIIGGIVIALVPAKNLVHPFTENPGYVAGIGQVTELHPDREHITSGVPIGDVYPHGYNSNPPSSGRHWPYWEKCGFSRNGLEPGTTPVPDEVLVHNLEHGNIVLSYNFSDTALVDELEIAFNDIPLSQEWGIARWYDPIPEGTVVLTAWGVVDQWNIHENVLGIDPVRIRLFFETYHGVLGPEFPNGLPCSRGSSMPAN